MLDVVQHHLGRWASEHGRTGFDFDRTLYLDIGHGAIDGACYLFGDAGGFPRLAAKAARTEEGRAVLAAELANLVELERIGMNATRRRTPEPLGAWTEGDVLVTLQGALPGALLKNVPGAALFRGPALEATVRRVIDFWYELQDRSGIVRRTFSGRTYEEAVLATVRTFLGTFIVPPAERDWLERRFEGRGALEGLDLPWMVRHGDFCTANMVLRDDDGLGVFDWEFPLRPALPLFDLFYFFSSTRFPHRGRRGESDHFTSFAEVLWGHGPLSEHLARTVSETCRRFEVPRAALAELLLLATLELANMKYASFVEAAGLSVEQEGVVPDAEKPRRWRRLEDVNVPFARIREGRLLNLSLFVERGFPAWCAD